MNDRTKPDGATPLQGRKDGSPSKNTEMDIQRSPKRQPPSDVRFGMERIVTRNAAPTPAKPVPPRPKPDTPGNNG